MSESPSPAHVSPEERIAALVGRWLRKRNSGRRYWLVYFAWMAVLWFALVQFPAFGFLLLVGFFWRSMFQIAWAIRTAAGLIVMLKPVLENNEQGLAEERIAFAVFDAARLDRVWGERRVAAIRDAAWSLVGPGGPASNWDCRSGHAEICAHRADANAVRFWREVAAR